MATQATTALAVGSAKQSVPARPLKFKMENRSGRFPNVSYDLPVCIDTPGGN